MKRYLTIISSGFICIVLLFGTTNITLANENQSIEQIIKDYSLWTLLFVPLWYGISIKWVDQFSSWPLTKEND